MVSIPAQAGGALVWQFREAAKLEQLLLAGREDEAITAPGAFKALVGELPR